MFSSLPEVSLECIFPATLKAGGLLWVPDVRLGFVNNYDCRYHVHLLQSSKRDSVGAASPLGYSTQLGTQHRASAGLRPPPSAQACMCRPRLLPTPIKSMLLFFSTVKCILHTVALEVFAEGYGRHGSTQMHRVFSRACALAHKHNAGPISLWLQFSALFSHSQGGLLLIHCQ